jgi:hypothetical protein
MVKILISNELWCSCKIGSPGLGQGFFYLLLYIYYSGWDETHGTGESP